MLGYSLVLLATTMSAVGIVLTKLLANKVDNEDLVKNELYSLSGGKASNSFLPWFGCSHLRHRRIGETFCSDKPKALELWQGSSANKEFAYGDNLASPRLLIFYFFFLNPLIFFEQFDKSVNYM